MLLKTGSATIATEHGSKAAYPVSAALRIPPAMQQWYPAAPAMAIRLPVMLFPILLVLMECTQRSAAAILTYHAMVVTLALEAALLTT